jgi:hypothetical protein
MFGGRGCMTMAAGNFFPPEYKQLPFREGDLLVSRRGNGKFVVNKILKVDRCDFKKGSSINIQGQAFTATEDDYLLVVSAAYGDDEFQSMTEKRSRIKSEEASKIGRATIMFYSGR